VKPLPEEIPESSYRMLLETANRGIVVLDEHNRVLGGNQAMLELVGEAGRNSEGKTIFELLNVPDDGRPWNEVRELQIECPHGFVRHIRLRPLKEVPVEACTRWLSVIDITREERALRCNLALSEVASTLAFAGNTEETLNLVAARVMRAVGTLGCSIVLVKDRRVLRVGRHGLPDTYPQTISHLFEQPDSPTATLQAYLRGQPVVSRSGRLELLPWVHSEEVREYLRNAMWNVVYGVPLVFQGRSLGVLTCYYEREREPEQELLLFLQTVADQVAVLVENLRLMEELRGKAVLEERQRIARELHDSVTQALYGIGLGTNTARHHLQKNDAEAVARTLDYVASLAEAGQAEMRALIFELRPDSLESEGLVTILQRQILSLQSRHGLKVQSRLLEPPVALEVKHALYRVVQESLGNIVKHAGATEVSLSFELQPECLKIAIRDDGRGFDPTRDFPGHYGLETMGERLHALGGQLRVESAPGCGTTIRAEVPLSASTAELQ